MTVSHYFKSLHVYYLEGVFVLSTSGTVIGHLLHIKCNNLLKLIPVHNLNLLIAMGSSLKLLIANETDY